MRNLFNGKLFEIFISDYPKKIECHGITFFGEYLNKNNDKNMALAFKIKYTEKVFDFFDNKLRKKENICLAIKSIVYNLKIYRIFIDGENINIKPTIIIETIKNNDKNNKESL